MPLRGDKRCSITFQIISVWGDLSIWVSRKIKAPSSALNAGSALPASYHDNKPITIPQTIAILLVFQLVRTALALAISACVALTPGELVVELTASAVNSAVSAAACAAAALEADARASNPAVIVTFRYMDGNIEADSAPELPYAIV